MIKFMLFQSPYSRNQYGWTTAYKNGGPASKIPVTNRTGDSSNTGIKSSSPKIDIRTAKSKTRCKLATYSNTRGKSNSKGNKLTIIIQRSINRIAGTVSWVTNQIDIGKTEPISNKIPKYIPFKNNQAIWCLIYGKYFIIAY